MEKFGSCVEAWEHVASVRSSKMESGTLWLGRGHQREANDLG